MKAVLSSFKLFNVLHKAVHVVLCKWFEPRSHTITVS